MYSDQLQPLINAALAKWPALAYANGGSRAHAAAEIVAAGEITDLGVMPSGIDYWQCGNYQISIRGKRCDCHDNAAPVHDAGKLCKHRLAAMFVVKMRQCTQNALDELLSAARGDTLTLKIAVIYGETGRAYTMAGHRNDGHEWITYSQAHKYDIAPDQFERTLQRHGWRINGRPVKQGGLNYNYFLARIGSDAETEPEYTIHASDVRRVEREEQEKRFKEIEIGQELMQEVA